MAKPLHLLPQLLRRLASPMALLLFVALAPSFPLPASAFSPNVSSGEESPAAIGAPRSPERPGRKSMINRKRSQLVQRSVSRRFAGTCMHGRRNNMRLDG